MSAAKQHLKLAVQLPPRLSRFFAQYPPQSLSNQSETNAESALRGSVATSTFSNPATGETIPPALQDHVAPSPFRAWRHPVTGRWHDPTFSLRRQAELVKMAKQHGVEDLLPHSIKGTAERQKRREENGLRVKGTGIGQKVKGKEWERTLKGRLEKRRQAMLEMPQMIQTWKERGHGRGWKKWPK